MIDFDKLMKGGGKPKLRTRSGLEVVSWRIQEDTPDSFFPIRATIKLPDGTTAEMPFNRNGRRFINTESEWDLEVARRRRRGYLTDKIDTMPEPLKAIQCYKKRDYSGIRSANKIGKVVFPSESVRYNVEIGSASNEGLG